VIPGLRHTIIDMLDRVTGPLDPPGARRYFPDRSSAWWPLAARTVTKL
jgi:hypothetical protein